MGQKGKEILELDVGKLIGLLNEALSEEWLAYYQYWIGSKVMEGPMRSEIEPELMVHANQELNHATLVADRIIQLGGTPVLDPKGWFELAGCAYESPEDPYVEAVLEQNLRGERCAIDRYNALAGFTESLRQEVNPHGIRVVNVIPGKTATAMQEELHRRKNVKMMGELFIQPYEIAYTIVRVLKLPFNAEITELAIRPMKKSWVNSRTTKTGYSTTLTRTM